MSAREGTGEMTAEAEQHERADGVDGDVTVVDDVVVVADGDAAGDAGDDVAVVDDVVVVADGDASRGGVEVVDLADNGELDPDAGPVVEVVVVPDAYAIADHADAPQVFASAIRLRSLFTALWVVVMIGVALAVYGISVVVTA